MAQMPLRSGNGVLRLMLPPSPSCPPPSKPTIHRLPSVLSIMLCPLPAATACTERSEEHTSELQSLMRISYAVFCLKKKKNKQTHKTTSQTRHNKIHKHYRYHSNNTTFKPQKMQAKT